VERRETRSGTHRASLTQVVAPIRLLRGQRLLDLLVARETAGSGLGVDQLAVHAHLEPAAARRLQRQFPDPVLVGVQESFRQTGGFGEVPSSGAVFDADVHCCHLRE